MSDKGTEYLKVDDFLAGILGEEEDVVLPGLGTVRIRPLTAVEASRLYDRTQEPGELALRAVGMALVQPRLSEAQVEQMLKGAAGRMTPLIQRVMALAGMTDSEAAENLAGGGS
jgi:hypothetical protein